MLKKIATNTISQILSKASTAIISIFLLSILTNYLSIELFWLYNKVYNYLSIFAFLADMGLYTIAIREISKGKEEQSKIVGNIMSLRLVLWIGIIFLACGLAFFLPWYNTSLALISIFITSIFTVFSLINSAVLALMQANMKIEFNLASTTAWKLVNLFCIWLIVFTLFPHPAIWEYNTPFIAIIIAWLTGMVVNTILNYVYAKRFFSFRFLWDKEYILHILKISLPYGFALFLSVVYFKIDIVLLSFLEPKWSADTSIALYSLPMKIVEVLTVLWGFYLNSILPSLSEYFHNGKKEAAERLLTYSFKILFSLGCMFFTLGVVLRHQIIHIIAKPEYLSPTLRFDSADAMVVVLWVVVFYFISNIFNYILIASENQSKLLRINAIVTGVNIIGNIIMIPYFSFIWSGIVTLVSQIVLFLLGFMYSRKIITFSFGWWFVWGSVIFSTVMYFFWDFLLNILPIADIYKVVFVGSIISLMYAATLFVVLKKKWKFL